MQQVTTTTQPVDNKQHAYVAVMQMVNFLFGIVETLLFLRFALKLIGANTASGFVRFIYQVSSAFMTPFRFILPTASEGQYVFEWSVLVAITIYALGAYLINQLVSVVYSADEAND